MRLRIELNTLKSDPQTLQSPLIHQSIFFTLSKLRKELKSYPHLPRSSCGCWDDSAKALAGLCSKRYVNYVRNTATVTFVNSNRRKNKQENQTLGIGKKACKYEYRLCKR